MKLFSLLKKLEHSHKSKLKKYIMKNITLTIIMLLSIALINAQSLVSIDNQEFTFSSGTKEAMKFSFKDVNSTELTATLKDYFRKNYNVRVSDVRRTAGEYEIPDFKATDIQQKLTFAVVRIIELQGNAIMYIHYTADGYVVSEKNTPAIYPQYKNLTQKLANQAIKLSYNTKIELNKKTLADQEKALADFIKAEEKNKVDLLKLNSEIETVDLRVERLEADLAQQKEVVISRERLVTAKEVEIASVDVKSLNKEIRKTNNDNKKADRSINRIDKQITKLQEKIVSLENEKESLNSSKIENNSKISGLENEISTHNQAALEQQLRILQKDARDAISSEKNILKSIEKERSTIEKNNVSIKEINIKSATINASQKTKTTEIEQTKEIIKALESEVTKVK